MAVPFVKSDDWDPEVALANARRDFGEVREKEFLSDHRLGKARDCFVFSFVRFFHFPPLCLLFLSFTSLSLNQ